MYSIPFLYKKSAHAELHHKNLQKCWDGHKKLITVASERGGFWSDQKHLLSFPVSTLSVLAYQCAVI